VSFEHPSEAQAAGWAEDYLKRRGCKIEPKALNSLIARVGADMMRLASELDKLSAYAAGGKIGLEAVEELVPRVREHSNFELWDALIEKDAKRAVKLANRLLNDGSEPVMIVGALAGLYRRMLIAKDLLARNAGAQEISRATGQYGPRGATFNKQVGRLRREEIARAITRIAEVDNAIKSSEGAPRLQIEYLIAELTLP
jgi:DNA polymerase-3 subunit delta